MKYKVLSIAKKRAKSALQLRKSLPKRQKFGLNKAQANKLGINSGVERAKQLIKNNAIDENSARRIVAFYERFKNLRTPKGIGSLNLWGGREYALYLKKQLKDRK